MELLKNMDKINIELDNVSSEIDVLRNRLRSAEKDKYSLEKEKNNILWKDKLDLLDSKLETMIENKEISPYFGGPMTSAYSHIVKIVANESFHSRLNNADVVKAIAKCLPLIEQYHDSIDPNK